MRCGRSGAQPGEIAREAALVVEPVVIPPSHNDCPFVGLPFCSPVKLVPIYRAAPLQQPSRFREHRVAAEHSLVRHALGTSEILCLPLNESRFVSWERRRHKEELPDLQSRVRLRQSDIVVRQSSPQPVENQLPVDAPWNLETLRHQPRQCNLQGFDTQQPPPFAPLFSIRTLKSLRVGVDAVMVIAVGRSNRHDLHGRIGNAVACRFPSPLLDPLPNACCRRPCGGVTPGCGRV